MLEIQLDDRALFLERWRTLLLEVLDQTTVAGEPQRRQVRQQVKDWRGYAAVDAVGYRLVREFRRRAHDKAFGGLLAGILE
jgi:penicillin amidase